MFGFARKEPPMPADDATASKSSIAFTAPLKPAALQVAERALSAARQERDKIHSAMIVAIRQHHESSGRTGSPEINRLAAEVEAAEEAVKAARIAIYAERERFRPAFVKAVRDLAAEANYEIIAALDTLDMVADALITAQQFGEANRLDTPRIATKSWMLKRLIVECRSIVGVTPKAQR